jgi:hypothetical protein
VAGIKMIVMYKWFKQKRVNESPATEFEKKKKSFM